MARRCGVSGFVFLSVTSYCGAGALARGQPPASASSTPDAPPARAALAKALDPRDYGRAFTVGAQAELVGPNVGAASLQAGYDAVSVQLEASVGLVAGDEIGQITAERDAYVLGLRASVPVHRGVRADLGLTLGGGVIIVDAPEAGSDVIGTVGAGARVRVFLTPNVATVAELGFLSAFDEDGLRVFAGARPLGAAGVTYFIR